MILNPAVIALLMGSFLIAFLVLYASSHGLQIIRRWDLTSGAEGQIDLEKRTYLISTLMTYAFVFEIFSFFLFVFTVDELHTLFTGAMCAAGTLNVNAFGYPALLVKVFNCLLAGIWLFINIADNRAVDYPLIKKKYIVLLLIAPSILLETFLQGAYFARLDPHVITSCCGSLFNTEKKGVAAGIAALPHAATTIVLFAVVGTTLVSGILSLASGGGKRVGLIFSISSLATFVVSAAALISFICVYIYELPTHHCPFCILHKEYHYIGYALYILLLAGAIAGGSAGVLARYRNVASLRSILPLLERQLTIGALIAFALFAAIVIYEMVASNLILFDL